MNNTTLVHYDAARKALAEAKSFDEVKEIRDKAEAMRAYARQAKNKHLEADAASLRIRAERELGKMLQKTEKAKAGRRKKPGKESVPSGDQFPPATLKEIGIPKKLSASSRKLAAVPDEVFEEKLADLNRRVKEEGERATTDLLKIGASEQKIERSADGRLELRVPIKEYEAWKEAASEEGLVLSEWARQKLNTGLKRIVEISVKPVKPSGNGNKNCESVPSTGKAMRTEPPPGSKWSSRGWHYVLDSFHREPTEAEWNLYQKGIL